MKIHMNHYASADCSMQPGNIKILPHCLKEYGIKIFYLELRSKEITFPMHYKNLFMATNDRRFLVKFNVSTPQCNAHHKCILIQTTYKLPLPSIRV